MRSWLVALSFAAAVAVLGMWPGSSGAIVCPAKPGVMVPPPCCSPEMSAASVPSSCCPTYCCAPICCATVCCDTAHPQPACPAEQITISSSPNPSSEGQEVTILGRVTSGAPQATVYLWQELGGQTSFTRIAQTATDAAGDYTFVRDVGVLRTNASWYASSAATYSPTLMQNVRAKVRFTSRSIDGTLVTLHGHVSPSHRGERIWLERYTTTKRWEIVTSSVIGRLSKFTVRHRFAHGGSVLLRTVFRGDARNVRSKSALLRIGLT